jgi:hypothetical protein
MLVIRATGAKFSNFLGRQAGYAQQPQITQIFLGDNWFSSNKC